MNYSKQIAWAVMLGIMSVATPPIWAQSGVHTEGTGHRMLTPGDLTWVEVPSLPPGAKLALIEGPLNEPVPFTFRLQFPANYQIPAHGIRRLSGCWRCGRAARCKTNHFVWTKEEAVVQLNGTGPWGITYVNPADDPRKK